MDWIVWVAGGAGLGGLALLWGILHIFDKTSAKAGQADLWRLKYEEAERQITKLKAAQKAFAEPPPDNWADTVGRL